MSTLRVNVVENLNGATILDGSTGTLVLPAGTETVAPLRFTAGGELTTEVAGSVEYTGRNFYFTPYAAAGQALNDSSYFYALNADRPVVGTVVAATFYSMFGVGIPVSANTTYFFELVAGVRTGTTSHTVSFTMGGTATYGLQNMYFTDFLPLALSTGLAAPGTPTATTSLAFNGSMPVTTANAVISAASILASKAFRATGMIEVTGSGTINPQIGFSANPTGTNQISRYSYIKLIPVGNNTTDIFSGNWA